MENDRVHGAGSGQGSAELDPDARCVRDGLLSVSKAARLKNQVSESLRDLSALSEVAPELVQTFAALASDVALVVDENGVIGNLAWGGNGPLTPGASDWVGRPWAETVAADARGKIEELLREVALSGVSRRREINHRSANGTDVPVAYTAVRLGPDGPVLAVGRDLRAIAGIQQQFVDAQQEIEREYWKHRQAESRYRVLFQVATDAVLVVDATSLRIIDANDAASALFDLTLEQLINMEAATAIDRSSRPAMSELLSAARATGLPGEMRVWLAGRRVSARISATPFRSADAMLLLLRVRAVESNADAAQARGTLIKLVERTPDSVVVADTSGRILMANPAFVELAQFVDEDHARGRHLADLLSAELADLISAARSRGIAADRTMTLRGMRGRRTPIEVSAALLAEEDQECIGLTIRVRERDAVRRSRGRRKATELAIALDSLTQQLGSLELPQLLSKVTQNAQRHFVQTAMGIAGRDPAEAARILGVSIGQLEEYLRQIDKPFENGEESGPKVSG